MLKFGNPSFCFGPWLITYRKPDCGLLMKRRASSPEPKIIFSNVANGLALGLRLGSASRLQGVTDISVRRHGKRSLSRLRAGLIPEAETQ